MGHPRDRLAEMQQTAYFDEDDDNSIQTEEQMDGNFNFNSFKLFNVNCHIICETISITTIN